MLVQNSSATNEWQRQQLCDIIDKVIRKLPEIGSAFIVNSRQNTSTHVCSLDIEIQTQAKLQNIRSQNLWKNKGGPSSIISKCTRKFFQGKPFRSWGIWKIARMFRFHETFITHWLQSHNNNVPQLIFARNWSAYRLNQYCSCLWTQMTCCRRSGFPIFCEDFF